MFTPSDSTLTAPDAARAEKVRDEFRTLTAELVGRLTGEEVLLASLRGEDSDYVRLNHGKVRQAGSVTQRAVSLHLVRGKRHVEATVSLTGDTDADRARLKDELERLRERLPSVPEDPYLNYARDVESSQSRADAVLPSAGTALAEVRERAAGRDMVGVFASGAVYAAHQNSLGQFNWYDNRSFNLDWSFYHARDKAVKSSYAGFAWDGEALQRKIDTAARQLEALRREPRTVSPGTYRVYLAPAAMQDILQLLSWGGFGRKALETSQTPLLKLARGDATLHPGVRISEHTAEGIAPDFQAEGFRRPPEVELVGGGVLAGTLVSPRSAVEYGVPTNGASAAEAPESLDMAPGDLAEPDVLGRLEKGIWIGNVWYLNYSDRAACRTTGMTRFATFWVENGEIAQPLNVMRFDETIYRVLGGNLLSLTREREMIVEAATYFARQLGSAHVPGALVEDFRLTL